MFDSNNSELFYYILIGQIKLISKLRKIDD